ncbi:MAG: DUF4279 domain-containing protein [Candidatus Microbacterium colombiense]|nr:MAG: DUF4279 domain-containing protein [Microbacterium sp.]
MNDTQSPHGTSRIGMNLAYFNIASETLSLADITRITGEDADKGWSVGEMYRLPRMVIERPRRASTWTRYSSAGYGLSVQLSLDGLYGHVERIADRVASQHELICSVQIVQYVSNPAAEIGFNVDRRWLTLLASIDASLDVDQYRDDPSDSHG